MNRPLRTALVLLGLLGLLAPPALAASSRPPSPDVSTREAGSPEARRWWRHVEFLASDALAGRNTGSEGYREAARYVAAQLADAGVRPGAGEGFLQPVRLESRKVVEARSRLVLVRDGRQVPLVLGEHALLSARVGQAGLTEAPLVFVGHGLSLPEAGHDDLAGVDLKGKLAVILTRAGPAHLSGALRAHGSTLAERWRALQQAGAVGMVTVAHPKSMDVPWERSSLARLHPSMVLAEAGLQDGRGMRLDVTIHPAHMDRLLEGSGHTFAELLALVDANKPLPRFPLKGTLKAQVALETAPVESANVVGVLPGSDPRLKDEYVVLSAHLDHVGVGEPIGGDRIYNGAMDNASGIASLLEVARALGASGTKLRRSVLFLAVTAEEKGLLGSRLFATRPTVDGERLVANLNLDMFLPLHRLERVVAYGLDESTLAEHLQGAARAAGVEVMADPEPEKLRFIRSDQYNFVRTGVPALAFKFGAAPGSPEERLQQEWYRKRYHAPSDDLAQPVDREAAARFNRLMSDLLQRVANADARPEWRATSFFRRFARQAQEATPTTP